MHQKCGTHWVFIGWCSRGEKFRRQRTDTFLQPRFWEHPQQSTKKRRRRECWVHRRGVRLLSKPLFDRNVYQHPVCKALAKSQCPWRLSYDFLETGCWMWSGSCGCSTYITVREAGGGCSWPLCHCVGPAVQTQQTAPETKVPGILGRARQEDNNLKEQNPQVNRVSITSCKPKLRAPFPRHPTRPQLLLRKHISSWELHQNQAKYFAWEVWLDVNGEDIYSPLSSTFQKIISDAPMCWLHPDGPPAGIAL